MSTIDKTKDTDAAIMSAFLNKDEKVLVQWYDKMKSSFMIMSLRYKLNAETGLDLYQDAVASLYVRIRDGKMQDVRSGGLEGYLMHMGRNKIVDYIRRNVKSEDSKLENELIERAKEHVTIELTETSLSDEQRYLSAGLKELGSRCYEVIKLFYYEGLSIDEIMTYMKYKDTNTVKALKSRCMKQLRTQIRK